MMPIFLLLLAPAWICLLWILIPWLVHMDMTKSHSDYVGWANFKLFKKVFENEVKALEEKGRWEKATWSKYFIQAYNKETGTILCPDIYVHASIIAFRKKGMLMRTPWDYFRVIKYCKKFNKKNIKIEW